VNASQILLAALTVAGLAIGQILFKLAATGAGSGPTLAGITVSGHLIAGLVIYVAATGLWLALLRTAPLSLAYPFLALAYVIVPLLAAWWLDEALRWQTLAGAAVIVFGVWLSGQGR
jgi:drug/metabolite transporter (DMT)-like permease